MSDWPSIQAPEGVDPDAWNAAVAGLRARCGWHIAPVITERLTLDGDGGTIVMLPSLEVVSVDEVREDGRVVSDVTESRYGMLRKKHGGRWSNQYFGNIEVELTHGYDEFPPELLAVLTEAAQYGVAGSIIGQVGAVKYGGSGALPGAASFMGAQSSVLDRYTLGALP